MKLNIAFILYLFSIFDFVFFISDRFSLRKRVIISVHIVDECLTCLWARVSNCRKMAWRHERRRKKEQVFIAQVRDCNGVRYLSSPSALFFLLFVYE